MLQNLAVDCTWADEALYNDLLAATRRQKRAEPATVFAKAKETMASIATPWLQDVLDSRKHLRILQGSPSAAGFVRVLLHQLPDPSYFVLSIFC